METIVGLVVIVVSIMCAIVVSCVMIVLDKLREEYRGSSLKSSKEDMSRKAMFEFIAKRGLLQTWVVVHKLGLMHHASDADVEDQLDFDKALKLLSPEEFGMIIGTLLANKLTTPKEVAEELVRNYFDQAVSFEDLKKIISVIHGRHRTIGEEIANALLINNEDFGKKVIEDGVKAILGQ